MLVLTAGAHNISYGLQVRQDVTGTMQVSFARIEPNATIKLYTFDDHPWCRLMPLHLYVQHSNAIRHW